MPRIPIHRFPSIPYWRKITISIRTANEKSNRSYFDAAAFRYIASLSFHIGVKKTISIRTANEKSNRYDFGTLFSMNRFPFVPYRRKKKRSIRTANEKSHRCVRFRYRIRWQVQYTYHRVPCNSMSAYKHDIGTNRKRKIKSIRVRCRIFDE